MSPFFVRRILLKDSTLKLPWGCIGCRMSQYFTQMYSTPYGGRRKKPAVQLRSGGWSYRPLHLRWATKKKNWPCFPLNPGSSVGILVMICYYLPNNWVGFHPQKKTLDNQGPFFFIAQGQWTKESVASCRNPIESYIRTPSRSWHFERKDSGSKWWLLGQNEDLSQIGRWK